VLQCGAPAAALLHMADTACKYNVLLTLDYSKVGSCPLALLQEHINMDEVISAIVIVGNPAHLPCVVRDRFSKMRQKSLTFES
jgi:hypothetical protein